MCTISNVVPNNWKRLPDEFYDKYKNSEIIEIPEYINNKLTNYIPSCSFEDNLKVKKVHIPDSVVAMGDSVFMRCRNLVSVRLPTGLEILSKSSFAGCNNLKHVILPPKLLVIENQTFNGCCSLKSMYIPDSVETIEIYAFIYCQNLVSLSLPSKLTNIKDTVFMKSGLKHAYIRYRSDVFTERSGLEHVRYHWLRADTTLHHVNLCMLELFEIALMSVLNLLDKNCVDDDVNIGAWLVDKYVPISDV